MALLLVEQSDAGDDRAVGCNRVSAAKRKNEIRFPSDGAAAAFMSAVSATYILMAEEGFRLSAAIACPIGAGFALVLLCAYVSVFLARVKPASRTENWRRS